jgi:hypothetical protein
MRLKIANSFQKYIQVSFQLYSCHRNKVTATATIHFSLNVTAQEIRDTVLARMEIVGKPNLLYTLTGLNGAPPMPRPFNELEHVQGALDEVKQEMKGARKKYKGIDVKNNVGFLQ